MAKKRKRIRIILGVLVTLFGLLLGTLYYLLPVGSAFAAKTMCSCVFVAGYPEDSVRKVELQTLGMFDVKVDYDKKRTTGSFMGLRPQVVIYRPNFGCSIAAGANPDELQQTLAQPPQRYLLDPLSVDTLPWPTGKRDTLPFPQGVDSAKLAQVVNGIFIEDFPGAKKNTRAALVVYQGKIVAEQYAAGFDSESLLRGWSMTKSVTNAMLGRLVQEKGFDIFQPAPVPEWQDAEDPRRKITTDMLLRMSSGLDFAEFYAFRTDATEMLFLSQDAAAYAARSDLAHEPDSHWSYSSGTSNLLSRIIRDQFPDDQSYWDFPYQSLFGPMGMQGVVLEPDASGTFVGSSFMWARARDWARFGLLYLAEGEWNGKQLLPEAWAAYSATSTPASPAGIYGAQFWNPATTPVEGWYEGWSWSGVPDDAYCAEGFEGQLVCIIPSMETVVVRLGVTHDRSAWDMGVWVEDILSCLPQP